MFVATGCYNVATGNLIFPPCQCLLLLVVIVVAYLFGDFSELIF